MLPRFRWVLPCLLALSTALASPSDTARAVGLLLTGDASASTSAAGTLTEQFDHLSQRLASDAKLADATAANARIDAFGGVELDAPIAQTHSYTARLQEHLAWLGQHPAAYAAVIQAAYRFVINRDAYAEEVAYWQKQPETLSYIMLVAGIEDWARRNQPGLMVTAGQATASINCEFLSTARLSPADAAIARELFGLPAVTEPGCHVLAASAAHLKSPGGIHFAAAGARSD